MLHFMRNGEFLDYMPKEHQDDYFLEHHCVWCGYEMNSNLIEHGWILDDSNSYSETLVSRE